jgi:DNA-directed RNA polymerase subunit K/omega
MKKLILSRGPQVDIQQCTRLVGGNKFELVLIASQRARDLRKQNPTTRSNFVVDALLNLQDQQLDPKEMLEKRASYINKPAKKVDNGRTKKVK